jgi:hypothetical protein
MNDRNSFQQSFELTQKLYRTMVYGVFLYPLFVALTETFHWAVFVFLNFETMKQMGLVFMILSIVIFPLSQITEHYFVRGCRDIHILGRKMMYADITNMAMSELITVFGLVIYITSANLKFFYLFFVISFVHLITVRPNRKRWQKRLDKITMH